MIPAFERLTGPGVALRALAERVGATVLGDGSPRVVGIRHDSRQVGPGEVFVARKGEHADGLAHVGDAIARGACAVVATRDHRPAAVPVPLLVVDDVRAALAAGADLVYGEPSRELRMVGITGTNGKTTTASLLGDVLRRAGHRPALLGTLGITFGPHAFTLRHNTPEADELTRALRWLRGEGASHAVMEATSHALAQKRTDGVRFRVAAFTNLTHDHLDLHPSFEAYGLAKQRLFTALGPAASVVMIDDPFGAELAEGCRAPVTRVSRRRDRRADVCPVQARVDCGRGIACRVRTPSGHVELRSSSFGEHNLANLLLALALAIELGVDADAAAAALSEAPLPPGRLEACHGAEDDVLVFVDYAHTPDGLEKALQAVRPWTKGRVTCVFGCGGDRDGTKREPMGEVAAALADAVFVTSDNPRREPPEQIAEQVLQGTRGSAARVVVELDRAAAVTRAVSEAAPGDVVLIAGKGHERVQVTAAGPAPFDDRERAREALSRRMT